MNIWGWMNCNKIFFGSVTNKNNNFFNSFDVWLNSCSNYKSGRTIALQQQQKK